MCLGVQTEGPILRLALRYFIRGDFQKLYPVLFNKRKIICNQYGKILELQSTYREGPITAAFFCSSCIMCFKEKVQKQNEEDLLSIHVTYSRPFPRYLPIVENLTLAAAYLNAE